MPAEAHIHDFDDFDDDLLDEALDREFDEDPDSDDAPEDDHTSGRYDRSPHAGPWSLPDITLEQLCEALTTTDPRSLAQQLGWSLADLLDIISRADFAEVASRHAGAFRTVAILRATAALPDAIEALRAVCAESDDPRQRRLAATALLRFLTARPPRSESPGPQPRVRQNSEPPPPVPEHCPPPAEPAPEPPASATALQALLEAIETGHHDAPHHAEQLDPNEIAPLDDPPAPGEAPAQRSDAEEPAPSADSAEPDCDPSYGVRNAAALAAYHQNLTCAISRAPP